jgi:hypothetical protein
MPILHIVNGGSTRAGLERSSVPGTFSAWSDVLHEGPTPAGASADEWRRVRVAYLASQGYGTPLEIEAHYAREEAAIERWREHEEVVLWFEHDLYDQLILIRLLAWLGARRAAGEGAATRLSLVCDDTYLGPLRPEQFPPLFAMREPIAGAQIDLAARAWTAFCSDDPRTLLPFAEPSRDLPYLAGAVSRHLEDFPSAANGLSRSEQQILRILAAQGLPPDELFGALTKTEERIFMGDASFWTIVKRLNAGPYPLLTIDVHERRGRLPSGSVKITSAGRDVASNRADAIALNGIDRWMGGTHLTSPRCWRWTGATLTMAD